MLRKITDSNSAPTKNECNNTVLGRQHTTEKQCHLFLWKTNQSRLSFYKSLFQSPCYHNKNRSSHSAEVCFPGIYTCTLNPSPSGYHNTFNSLHIPTEILPGLSSCTFLTNLSNSRLSYISDPSLLSLPAVCKGTAHCRI